MDGSAVFCGVLLPVMENTSLALSMFLEKVYDAFSNRPLASRRSRPTCRELKFESPPLVRVRRDPWRLSRRPVSVAVGLVLAGVIRIEEGTSGLKSSLAYSLVPFDPTYDTSSNKPDGSSR